MIVPPTKKRRRSGKQQIADQQTITQMDPFKKLASIDHESTDLGQQYTTVAKTPPRKKKRAVKSTTPIVSIIQTRSAKRRAAEANVDTSNIGVMSAPQRKTEKIIQDSSSCQAIQMRAQMPPPQTPKTVRRKVIPSSQSPADTPISTRHQKGIDTQTLTPLKDRCVNTPSKSRLRNRRTSLKRKPKLEIANSTGVENEDSQIFPPIVFQGDETKLKNEEHSSLRLHRILNTSQTSTSARGHQLDEQDTKRPSVIPRQPGLFSFARKHTISDSEKEETAHSFQRFNQSVESLQGTPDPEATSIVNPNTPRISDALSYRHHNSSHMQGPLTEATSTLGSYESIPTQPIPLFRDRQTPIPCIAAATTPSLPHPSSSTKTTPTNSPPAHPSFTLPPSASALESDSQFAAAWRAYTPPLPEPSPLQPSYQEETFPVESALPHTSSTTDLDTLPAAAVVPHPGSQAVATETTRASSSPLSPRSGALSIQLHDPNEGVTITLSSSPPAPQSPSAYEQDNRHGIDESGVVHADLNEHVYDDEPANERIAAEQQADQGLWNGIPMTDSQLLPASLLRDSLATFNPAYFADEDLDLETDEEL
ncbi:MAG: hypothetical protein Q9220_000412 [cf. Caloplaca sp. 1 TL-2023]